MNIITNLNELITKNLLLFTDYFKKGLTYLKKNLLFFKISWIMSNVARSDKL